MEVDHPFSSSRTYFVGEAPHRGGERNSDLTNQHAKIHKQTSIKPITIHVLKDEHVFQGF